jgi:polyphosphate kinase 2
VAKKNPGRTGLDDRESELIPLKKREYAALITPLHAELLKLQNHVKHEGLRICTLFEGRDAAGKGGAIKRFIQHMNPRGCRVVALEKPSDRERTQWYFQRYAAHLPTAGEIVLFDRSWYNRAMVERVMGFCTKDETREFLRAVPAFEEMLVRSGIHLHKFYFSVSREEQARRFHKRETDPLKQWKLTEVDRKSQDLWDDYTKAKLKMFEATATVVSPWWVIRCDDKRRARLNAIRLFLSSLDYPDRREHLLDLDPRIVIKVTPDQPFTMLP